MWGALATAAPAKALLCWGVARLGDLTQRWGQDSLQRGAYWFGIACAAMPLLLVLDDHSVFDALLAARELAFWTVLPLRVWVMLVWIAGCGFAAARVMAWLAPRGRMRLLAAGAALHLGFGIVAQMRLGWLLALLSFGLCFAALRAARDTWPLGHPGAPG